MADVDRQETGTDTRQSLLDAAERLFAQHGIDAASLRAITREAGANLASVHYHFGSKDGLVRAVFARRLGPMNQERLELLDRLLAEREPPPLEAVIRAFVAPVVSMGCGLADVETESSARQFPRLLSRAFGEPEERARAILLDEFRLVKERYLEVFARLLPDLPKADLYWRFHFMIGAMAHTASTGDLIRHYSSGTVADDDPDDKLERLVAFLAGGWRA